MVRSEPSLVLAGLLDSSPWWATQESCAELVKDWFIPSWQGEVLTCVQQSWGYNSVLCSCTMLVLGDFLMLPLISEILVFFFLILAHLCACWIDTYVLDCSLSLTPDLLSSSRVSAPWSQPFLGESRWKWLQEKQIRHLRTARAFQSPCSAADFLFSGCDLLSAPYMTTETDKMWQSWETKGV